MSQIPLPYITFVQIFYEKYPTYAKMVDRSINVTPLTRSLCMLDYLTEGTPSTYARIVEHQDEEDMMSYEAFSRLANYFYLFKQRPELFRLAELYLIYEYYGRTFLANEDYDLFSKEEKADMTRYALTQKFIEKGFLDEVHDMSLASFESLRRIFGYADQLERAYETGQKLASNPQLTEAERRVVFGGVVCEVASMVGCSINDSLTLTESVASGFAFLLENSHDENFASLLIQYKER